jgi:uncharacterized protein YhdP
LKAGHDIDAARDGRSAANRADEGGIPNLSAPFPVLTVTGDATGRPRNSSAISTHSPVAGWIGHATSGATATGPESSNSSSDSSRAARWRKVAGGYLSSATTCALGELPTLAKVNGRLAFTEQDLQAQDVALEALGGPAKVAIASVDGEVRVAGSGTANLATLNRELARRCSNAFPGLPIGN